MFLLRPAKNLLNRSGLSLHPPRHGFHQTGLRVLKQTIGLGLNAKRLLNAKSVHLIMFC